jgi:glycerol-3-phosphate acyltransferase PlsY
LLLNIVVNAVLSLPYPFQQFAFDQPNVAVLYFPFTWLPCFIVVIVLYSHLAAIRKLLKGQST